jgi:hypothetical protein
MTHFEDAQGPTLEHYQESGTTVISIRYDETLRNQLKPEILSFRTLSIVLALKNKLRETRRFGNWICIRPQMRGKKPYSVGSLRKS